MTTKTPAAVLFSDVLTAFSGSITVKDYEKAATFYCNYLLKD